MANKKLKFKAEASAPPKPQPKMPSAGKGPKIEIPKQGPKITVPKELEKEVLDYNARSSASKIRGVASETLEAREAAKAVRGVGQGALEAKRMLPTEAGATKTAIRLPEKVASQAAKNMTVETTAKVTSEAPKKFIPRAAVEEMGVKETIKAGAGRAPQQLRLPAPLKVATEGAKAAVKEAEAVAKPVAETSKSVLSKLGDLSKKAGKALVSEENPYRKMVGRQLEKTSVLGKLKNIASGAGKVARFGAKASRVASRLATPVALADIAYSQLAEDKYMGVIPTIRGASSEYSKAESAFTERENTARRLSQKAGVKITRPEWQLKDTLGMTFIPGYNAPASDPNLIKVYDSKGEQIAGPKRKQKNGGK